MMLAPSPFAYEYLPDLMTQLLYIRTSRRAADLYYVVRPKIESVRRQRSSREGASGPPFLIQGLAWNPTA